jgi:hypothetical protein
MQTSGNAGKSNSLELRKVEVRKTPLVCCWMSAPRGCGGGGLHSVPRLSGRESPQAKEAKERMGSSGLVRWGAIDLWR